MTQFPPRYAAMKDNPSDTYVSFTPISANRKTGPMPTSMTEAKTCPDVCPFKKSGCYAKYSFVGIHWRNVTKNGMPWGAFLDKIKSLPRLTLWRHIVAGDLPGENNLINRDMLAGLVKANKGKRGFTYTHKDMTVKENRDAVASANAAGFTVNLSGNNPDHADSLKALGIGPVVTVLPREIDGNAIRSLETKGGNRIVICPATYRDNVTCQSCGLCQRADRTCIVGFPAHGTAAKTVSDIARNN